jgi:hypothetical protein
VNQSYCDSPNQRNYRGALKVARNVSYIGKGSLAGLEVKKTIAGVNRIPNNLGVD